MSNYRVITDLEDKRKMIILDKDEKDFSESDIDSIKKFIWVIVNLKSGFVKEKPVEKLYVRWLRNHSYEYGDCSNIKQYPTEQNETLFQLGGIIIYVNNIDLPVISQNPENDKAFLIIERYLKKYGEILINYINKEYK